MEKKVIWNEGAKTGLYLGLVAITFMILTWLLGNIHTNGAVAASALVAILNTALWLTKLLVCIFLMKAAMERFCAANPEAVNRDSFRVGVSSALLSALFYSAFYLAFVLFISPDYINEAIDTFTSSNMSRLDSNSLNAIEEMKGSLPQLTFFVNFLWCFLYGTVLSAILSRNIPSRNPFEQNSGE